MINSLNSILLEGTITSIIEKKEKDIIFSLNVISKYGRFDIPIYCTEKLANTVNIGYFIRVVGLLTKFKKEQLELFSENKEAIIIAEHIEIRNKK